MLKCNLRFLGDYDVLIFFDLFVLVFWDFFDFYVFWGYLWNL